LAAVALIIIISLLAGRGEEEKAAAPAAPPAAQPSVLEGTPRVMGPAMLNPRVPIGLAKDAASAAEEGHAETEGTYEEIQR
jgi:hypothetical protein